MALNSTKILHNSRHIREKKTRRQKTFFCLLTTLYLTVCGIFSILSVSCADIFQTKLDFDSSSKKALLKDFIKNPNAPIVLTSPAQLWVDKAVSTSQIRLSWTTVYGADYYHIYRATSPIVDGKSAAPTDDAYELVAAVYGTAYTDDKIMSNVVTPNNESPEFFQHYYYKVAGVLATTMEEGPMSPVGNGYLLAPVTSIKASTGTSSTSITVSWDPVMGAVRYKVYRTSAPDGTGVDMANPLATVTRPGFTDNIAPANQGLEFYYFVCCENNSGAVSVKSPLAMGFALKDGAAPAPKNVRAAKNASATSIRVEWDVVSGNGVEYAVYRNSASSSQLAMVTMPVTGDTFVEDSSVIPNEQYVYYVQSVTGNNTENEAKSSFSSEVLSSTEVAELSLDVPNTGYLLSPPRNAMAVATINADNSPNNRITFDAPLGAQSSFTYEIEYSASGENGTFAPLPVSYNQTDSGNFEAVDPGNSTGFYRFRSTSPDGIQSSYSEIIETSPLPVTSVSYKKLGGDDVTANTNDVYPVEINWVAVNGAKSYMVYRSTEKDRGFKAVSGVISDSSFTDTSLTVVGTVYHYKVLSLNSKGVGAFAENSAITSCYGLLTPRGFFRTMERTTLSSQKKLTLMNKPNNMDKLGKESIEGKISGTLSYNAKVAGLGARIEMHYTNYCDFTSSDGKSQMILNGDTNTDSDMSANGTMNGIVTVTGMYRGTVNYGGIKIVSGAAGGGHYAVTVMDDDGATIVSGNVTYKGE